ncbi:hypothetical protein [Pseudomonas fluorescens]|uniref:hypothetical protein n=1 Tax=Pseudomonas fluorescens TaxID=294 RepID=UPI00203595CE|nr:hypothetical protein [Pseudomonas fluorescens]
MTGIAFQVPPNAERTRGMNLMEPEMIERSHHELRKAFGDLLQGTVCKFAASIFDPISLPAKYDEQSHVLIDREEAAAKIYAARFDGTRSKRLDALPRADSSSLRTHYQVPAQRCFI